MMTGGCYWSSLCGNRSEYDAFWSYQLSINTSSPDLTDCFQKTLLTWIPCGCFLVTSIVYLVYLSTINTSHSWRAVSKLNVLKTIICLGMVITTFLNLIWTIHEDQHNKVYAVPADYIAYTIKLLALLQATFLTHWEFRKGIHSSGVLFLFWLFLTFVEIIIFRSHIIRNYYVLINPILHRVFVTYSIYFGLLVVQFLSSFVPDTAALQVEGAPLESSDETTPLLGEATPLLKRMSNGKKEALSRKPGLKPCRMIGTPFWAYFTWLWFTPDIIRGYRKPFQFSDLHDIRDEEKCHTLVPHFDSIYYKKGYYSRSGSQEHGNFIWSLVRSVAGPVALAALFRVVSIPIQFLNPQLLGMLIDFISSDDDYIWKGLFLAVCMLLTNFIFSILLNHFLFNGFMAGLRARSILNQIVFRKALTLSSSAKRRTTTGQVVSLMSVDAQKIQDFFQYSTLLWSVPIMIALSVYFLYEVVGPSAFAGLAVLLILVPLNALYFGRKAMILQRSQMKQKDQRFRLMNEILAGIKVLKLYAWEPSFQRKVLDYREKELHDIKFANYINAFGSMCWLLSPYLVSLAIFGTYVLSSPDNVLDAKKAFVTLSLINLLNFPLSLLPMGVANTIQGIVSLRRISRFLDLEDIDDFNVVKDNTMFENVIEIQEGTFSWGSEEKPVLHGINASIGRGKLVAVVGQVGSGKSSLISAILGDMMKQQGTVKVNGKTAYVPQQAWIQNLSLRGNITFGSDFNSKKYNQIIEACALGPDLEILPGGDRTEIGEKGINLSGGQKQRVSIARAVYQDEDIYLLDDPLSAVDAHVGKHIFEKVIGPQGLLNDKTRVLVTHSITYLSQMDMIVTIKDGFVSEVGTYDQLLDKNGDFADFILTFINEELSKDESEAEDIKQLKTMLSLTDKSDTDGSEVAQSPRRRSSSARMRKISRMKSVDGEIEARQRKQSKIAQGTLIKEETAEQGLIQWKVLNSYIKAAGKLMLSSVFISHIMFMTAQVLTNIWLSEWSGDVETNNTEHKKRQSDRRLGVYGGLGGVQTLMALIEAFAVAQGCYHASRILHEKLLSRVLKAPMTFFDTTPLGRIMNRFSKDLDVIDANLPLSARQWLFAISPVLTTLILIIYSTPSFTFVVIPLMILFIILQRMYISAVRQLRRIDAVRRSPIYVHFDESVSGSTSIRAYGREAEFLEKSECLVDESQRTWFLILTSYRWCGIVMEFLGACVVFFSSMFAVLSKDTITPGLAGLSVSYSLQITVFMNTLIRCSSELETYIVSVERLDEYADVSQEASWDIPEETPFHEWPNKGMIEFKQYGTRYRPGLDLVLKEVSCSIRPQEKVGIVGRTGAGKSSLSLALFRIIEAACGNIYIDGKNIASLGLHDVRSRLAIIPQDPVVFSGSLRQNLDPFREYTDNQIWMALQHAHLKEFVSSLVEGLEYECGEGGESLSVGQRQLLCMARALLRDSRILVLDEATAAVDLETDALIQNTIRDKFNNCTILTVAHRLNTVLDYDRIMVLDKGRIHEFDSPQKLLMDKSSVFHAMAKDAGLV